MTLQLKYVFTSEGMRIREVEQQTTVYGGAISRLELGQRGVTWLGVLPLSAKAKGSKALPDTRMTPTPPRPGAVAMAAMVSAGFTPLTP